MSRIKRSSEKVIVVTEKTVKRKFVVGDDEKKTFFVFLSQPFDQQKDVEIKIAGSHANVTILGIVIGSQMSVVKLHTLQDHEKPDSISDLLIKSVLFDSSKFYYDGLIQVRKNAQKSNAYQKNQNLLLSENAWADSRPSLEILANDVRCTHGATVGTLSKDQLYYLKTRGITHEKASQLLIEGFLLEVLEKIPSDIIRSELTKKVLTKLESLVAPV